MIVLNKTSGFVQKRLFVTESGFTQRAAQIQNFYNRSRLKYPSLPPLDVHTTAVKAWMRLPWRKSGHVDAVLDRAICCSAPMPVLQELVASPLYKNEMIYANVSRAIQQNNLDALKIFIASPLCTASDLKWALMRTYSEGTCEQLEILLASPLCDTACIEAVLAQTVDTISRLDKLNHVLASPLCTVDVINEFLHRIYLPGSIGSHPDFQENLKAIEMRLKELRSYPLDNREAMQCALHVAIHRKDSKQLKTLLANPLCDSTCIEFAFAVASTEFAFSKNCPVPEMIEVLFASSACTTQVIKNMIKFYEGPSGSGRLLSCENARIKLLEKELERRGETALLRK